MAAQGSLEGEWEAVRTQGGDGGGRCKVYPLHAFLSWIKSSKEDADTGGEVSALGPCTPNLHGNQWMRCK